MAIHTGADQVTTTPLMPRTVTAQAREKQKNEEPFILSQAFLDQYTNRQPEWGPIGYVVYKRTYARSLETVPIRYQTLAAENNIHGSEEWWLTVCRVVEGCYQIQQRHCQNLDIHWWADKAQLSAQEMYKLIFEMKFLPPGRGLWMMGTDYVGKAGGAALNNCFAKETLFWADGRLVSFADLIEANVEQVMVETAVGQRQAVVHSFGKQKLQRVIFSPCGLRSNYVLDYNVTPNHRWILSDGSVTTNLKIGDRVTINPRVYDPESLDWKMGFAHGLVFGDGTQNTYYPERHFIRLCGKKDLKHRALLESIAGYVSTRPVSDSDDVIVTIVRRGEDWKTLPNNEKSAEYKAGFVAGWGSADGYMTSAGTVKLMSTNHAALDWAINHAGMLGYCVIGDNFDKTAETNFGLRTALIRRISLVRVSVEYQVRSITDEGREEEVYCVVEPETQSFMLSSGLITGNCAFVSTNEIRTAFSMPFCFLMDMSMLGVGVGGDTRGAGTINIVGPEIDYVNPHIVSDDREGWVALVRRCLEAFVGNDTWPHKIDYSLIRPAGAIIRGFGGTAAGSEPLKELVEGIKFILGRRVGYPILSSDIVDLFNMIGRCVVAGNVRRSAEIMFGEAHDENFLELKNYKKYPEETSRWRWASNNSIWAGVGMDYEDVATRTSLNGEPGYEWLENARNYGRMGRPPDYKDYRAMGGNPCLEQTLESFELCCLVETFPSLHDTYEEYERTLKFAYLYAKTVTLVPTHDKRTNQVLLRNRRIGCSQSGIIASMNRHGRREHLNWCDQGYNYLEQLDQMYAEWLCIPVSIKKTSVKPSGTVSKLPGVPPGIHHPHSEYYFNVVRMDMHSPLVAKHRAAGYRCVDLHPTEPNTTAVYFPVHEKHFVRGKNDVTMWEQLEIAAQMQTHWADNQVSVTVTFKRTKRLKDFPDLLSYLTGSAMSTPNALLPDPNMIIVKGEEDNIKYALELYETRLKGVSFLPNEDHGYSHAPYQEITKADYDEYVANLLPVDLRETQNETIDKFCDGEVCSVPVNVKPIESGANGTNGH